MRISFSTPACAALLVLLHAASGALTPLDGQVRLHGRVITEVAGEPIEGALVTLTNLRGNRVAERVTDVNGRFSFQVNRTSAVQLRAERIGYAEAMTPRLYFDDYDLFTVEIRLNEMAALLAPLEVTARSSSGPAGMLAAFEHRRVAAPGVFFTRDEIDARRPGYVTDLLATVPGVRLQSSGQGSRRTVIMGRSATTGECAAQIYIDGFLMNRDGAFALDDAVSPQTVHGIEVYRGISTVPADFLTPSARCGVVVIWTRRDKNNG